jgi:hypothetical protein
VLATTQLLGATHKLRVIHHSHHKHVMVGHHLELRGALTTAAKVSAKRMRSQSSWSSPFSMQSAPHPGERAGGGSARHQRARRR